MGDFWEVTAQMYSSLFEKPKMSEKLLSKPPFKYIFDIIAETSKVIPLLFSNHNFVLKGHWICERPPQRRRSQL